MLTGIRRILLALVLATAPCAAQKPEVIDRVVAAIGHTRIVTASDIRRERAIMAAIGETAKDDRAILEDLIGWLLVEDQMMNFPGLEVTDEELEAALKKNVNPAAAPISEVRAAVRERIRRAKYVERRFGQFIHVTDEEKEQYYRNVFLPRARQQGINPKGLDDPEMAAAIEFNLRTEKADTEFLNALAALRAMSDVEIFQ